MCQDEFLDTGGWPHQMYVREARRMISDYVMTEKNCRRVEVVPGDISDPQCVSRLAEARDVIFHLAALIAIPYSYAAAGSYVAANVTGTLNVLEAIRGSRSRPFLIFASTNKVYGAAPWMRVAEAHRRYRLLHPRGGVAEVRPPGGNRGPLSSEPGRAQHGLRGVLRRRGRVPPS